VANGVADTSSGYQRAGASPWRVSTGRDVRRPDMPPRPIAAALNFGPDHAAEIDRSHDRCVALGLPRIGQPDLGLIRGADLDVARARNQRLHQHAAPVMELLHDQIVNSHSMVVLTDATGTIIHSVGDDDFLVRASKIALQPGATWSEAQKGTNAVGTALVTELPTLVHADEHYFHANHFLTCSAAPILDPRGNILGVLDVSGDHRSYHQHTMALVKMSARMIENHWLTDDYRNVMRLHFHSRIGFIGTLMEGIIAVRPDGRIVGANRGALEQLGISGAALRMQTLESLFGTSVGMLVDRFRSPLATPLPVQHGAATLYLHARFEWPVWTSLAEAVAVQVPNAAKAPKRLPVSSGEALPDATEPATTRPPCIVHDAATAQVLVCLRRGLERGLAVVLQGETGSGKQWLARAAHDGLGRSTALRLINGRTAGPSDIDVAWMRFPGDAAAYTVCLVGPGELSADAQAHLVRCLDAASPFAPSMSLVCVTREPLRALAAAGRLREELAYRLNGLTLRVPPLRERTDAIALAQAFAGPEVHDIAADVQHLIRHHHWPGNVRELANVMRAAALLSGGAKVLGWRHLPPDFVEGVGATEGMAVASPGIAKSRSLEDMQLEAIRRAVEAAGGNIAEAARQLGISRNTIYRKLRWNDGS
jgi:transcriptional regulator of acetoin/glycerol metabolism